jgi:hypothetical protein
MLHRLKPSFTDPQSVPFVKAVVDAEPMRKRICVANGGLVRAWKGWVFRGLTKEMVSGIQ